MKEQIDIWLVGNTGLRNPNRIQDGFKVFAGSPFVGNLHGKDNEIGFMNLLNEKGIIQNEEGKDESGSHARKWRLMFAKNGFIYPQIKKKDGMQEDLGPVDNVPKSRYLCSSTRMLFASNERRTVSNAGWKALFLTVKMAACDYA